VETTRPGPTKQREKLDFIEDSQKMTLATKLYRINNSQYLWTVLRAWYQVCFAPCPYGLHFVHVDRERHSDNIDEFLTRFRSRSDEDRARLCLLGWQVVMVQRLYRLTKQTEYCVGKIERRDRATLTVHFHNWYRLVDDIRMGRAAKRIQDDSKRLTDLHDASSREFAKSDRLLELYAAVVRETDNRTTVAMAFYHWFTRSSSGITQRLKVREKEPERAPCGPSSIVSVLHFEANPNDTTPVEASESIVKTTALPPPTRKLRSSVSFAVDTKPPEPAVSSPSSSDSSSSSDDPSTVAIPSLFKVSLPFFMRMRKRVRDWAMRGRETVARRRQVAAVEQAVEQAVSAWRPVGVPMDIVSRMPISEALRLFKEGAPLQKRKGAGIHAISSSDLFGGLKNQTRYFIGQIENPENFFVYYRNSADARSGGTPSGVFSLDHMKAAQWNWKKKEFGALSDKMGENDDVVKKISHIPEKFFIALIIAIRHAIATQTRRATTVAYMTAASGSREGS
jgi:hypothetical protein